MKHGAFKTFDPMQFKYLSENAQVYCDKNLSLFS
jgi:hypothetical protein